MNGGELGLIAAAVRASRGAYVQARIEGEVATRASKSGAKSSGAIGPDDVRCWLERVETSESLFFARARSISTVSGLEVVKVAVGEAKWGEFWSKQGIAWVVFQIGSFS